jgi:hypothetical protein
MRRSPVIRLAVFTVLAVVLCSVTAFAAAGSSASVAGTWSGKYSGAYSGKFTLHWRLVGSQLHGTITLSRPQGSYGITGKVIRGGGISFGVVKVGATYTGHVFGTKMSGSYMTPGGGGSWSAHKVVVR